MDRKRACFWFAEASPSVTLRVHRLEVADAGTQIARPRANPVAIEIVVATAEVSCQTVMTVAAGRTLRVEHTLDTGIKGKQASRRWRAATAVVDAIHTRGRGYDALLASGAAARRITVHAGFGGGVALVIRATAASVIDAIHAQVGAEVALVGAAAAGVVDAIDAGGSSNDALKSSRTATGCVAVHADIRRGVALVIRGRATGVAGAVNTGVGGGFALAVHARTACVGGAINAGAIAIALANRRRVAADIGSDVHRGGRSVQARGRDTVIRCGVVRWVAVVWARNGGERSAVTDELLAVAVDAVIAKNRCWNRACAARSTVAYGVSAVGIEPRVSAVHCVVAGARAIQTLEGAATSAGVGVVGERRHAGGVASLGGARVAILIGRNVGRVGRGAGNVAVAGRLLAIVGDVGRQLLGFGDRPGGAAVADGHLAVLRHVRWKIGWGRIGNLLGPLTDVLFAVAVHLHEREHRRCWVQAIALDVTNVVCTRVIVIAVNAPAKVPTVSAGSAGSTARSPASGQWRRA